MINVNWSTTQTGEWFTIEGYNFSSITALGVYIIWCEGQPGIPIRIGQGVIGARLTAHKSDHLIMRHRTKGTMRVTWAEVPALSLDGVERFLGDLYQPIEGDRFPDATPLRVNLPGGR